MCAVRDLPKVCHVLYSLAAITRMKYSVYLAFSLILRNLPFGFAVASAEKTSEDYVF